MKNSVLDTLLARQLISPEQYATIRAHEQNRLFSVHWELKTVLYAGVLLLNIGLGLLIYLNIDTIGHLSVIALTAAISVGCFWYAYKNRAPFSSEKIESASPYFDYALLLGCLTFVILEGYAQYQYGVFGTHYGLATFLPMVLFFFVAYYFDHQGVLAMAITALASWLGIAVTPRELFVNNDFSSGRLIYTGLILGTILCGAAFFSLQQQIKRHFHFTYLNFGANILFLACICGLMVLGQEWLFSVLLTGVTVSIIWYARREKSFYFLILAVIYAYWGVSYLVFRIDLFQSTLMFYYFIFSCAGVIYLLAQYRKLLNAQDQ